MAKLGSKNNPLVLTVSDESKANDIIKICDDNDWRFIIGFEPGKEDLSDLEKKLKPPVIRHIKKIGRNDPCGCGSNKKAKKCCLITG